MAKNNSLSEFNFIAEILIEEWLKQDLGISRTKLKEFHFKKSWLSKLTKKKETLIFPLDLLNARLINPIFTGPEVRILYIDDALVTLSKPAGMHLFPLHYRETDTLLNFLRSQNFGRDILQVAPESHERGALYRLDRVTSGLMMFARTQIVYQKFRQNLEPQKYYLATVQGQVQTSSHQRHFLTGLSKGGAKVKCSQNASKESVEANIDILPLAFRADLNLSLIGIVLGEGHRHQIRVQMATLGYPIWGDVLYGGNAAERVFLHAWAYSFGARFFHDDTCPLFGKFFDLNSGLEMFRNHCGIGERR
ncbi:MAG: hypothetical protein HYV97_17665 [Bdellovibrio sp.]|nr:hypothetical protein [Bdellovibrio sp.]